MDRLPAAFVRLEPRPYERDLQEGITARVHDPLWFLARQWQMGEFQGENASSPVWVSYTLRSTPIEPNDPRFDPAVIPAEAIVESEIDDWWTMGRRIRLGRRVAGVTVLPDDLALRFADPPPPYEQFGGAWDGRALWRRRASLGLDPALFGEAIPENSLPAWNDERLVYQQRDEQAFPLSVGGLRVDHHHGGRLDWYSVTATPLMDELSGTSDEAEVLPAALSYPGAPNTRWWTAEHHELDIGAYVPDSARTPTAILTDLIFSHSDDWFLIPVRALAGTVVKIDAIEVTDAFGRPYASAEMIDGAFRWQGLHAPKAWNLLRVDGLPPQALVLWHVAEMPLESLPIERVQFGIDETSNLVWAVEQTVDSRDTVARTGNERPDGEPLNQGTPSGHLDGDRTFAYIPGQGMARYWHPYRLPEDNDAPGILEQKRLADLSLVEPAPFPRPQADVLKAADGDTHEIDRTVIPTNGFEISRRWNLARDMAGNPVLWIERQRGPLLSPPARRLRFDVMEERKIPVEP